MDEHKHDAVTGSVGEVAYGSVCDSTCMTADRSACFCHDRKVRTDEDMRALCNRLSRIEGQVRGIRGMVERDAYCPDILLQVTAVIAALQSFNRELLAEHIRTCVSEDLRAGQEGTVEELIAVLQKMVK